MGDENVEERWPFEGIGGDVEGMTLAEEQKVRISDMLCFALYAASRAAIDVYRPLLDELGLTYPQYLVMLVLWERQSCSVKDLGHLLHLDSGTLSPLLKRLEVVGYIARQRRRNDQRVVDIVLTEEGGNLKALASSIPQKISCQYGIEYDEYRDLLERLKKFTDHLLPK